MNNSTPIASPREETIKFLQLFARVYQPTQMEIEKKDDSICKKNNTPLAVC